jgi:hypothetical protein
MYNNQTLCDLQVVAGACCRMSKFKFLIGSLMGMRWEGPRLFKPGASMEARDLLTSFRASSQWVLPPQSTLPGHAHVFMRRKFVL